MTQSFVTETPASAYMEKIAGGLRVGDRHHPVS